MSGHYFKNIYLKTSYFIEIMRTNSLEMYEAPKVEIIEVEVEKGFALSNTGGEQGTPSDGGF